MTYWGARAGDAKLIINSEKLSDALWRAGEGRVTALAEQGASVGRAQLSPSDQRFVRARKALRFHLRQDSSVRSSLSKTLSIPVALVVNDSDFAFTQEFGGSHHAPSRPLQSAFEALRARGLRGVRGK